MSLRELRILHTNDLHGKLDDARLAQLLDARPSYDLWLDTGDAIRSGNLSLPLTPDPVWKRFSEGRLSAFCPGNRESHVWPAGVDGKFRGCQSPVLCSNWRRKSGELVWRDGLILELGGLKVGLFGVMVAMVTPRMKTQAASAYLWDSPFDAAARAASVLRPQVDVLLALTHIGLRGDQKLAGMGLGIDLILGGHSHSILESPDTTSGVPIVQGGSHGRYFGSIVLDVGRGEARSSLVPWGGSP